MNKKLSALTLLVSLSLSQVASGEEVPCAYMDRGARSRYAGGCSSIRKRA